MRIRSTLSLRQGGAAFESPDLALVLPDCRLYIDNSAVRSFSVRRILCICFTCTSWVRYKHGLYLPARPLFLVALINNEAQRQRQHVPNMPRIFRSDTVTLLAYLVAGHHYTRNQKENTRVGQYRCVLFRFSTKPLLFGILEGRGRLHDGVGGCSHGRRTAALLTTQCEIQRILRWHYD